METKGLGRKKIRFHDFLASGKAMTCPIFQYIHEMLRKNDRKTNNTVKMHIEMLWWRRFWAPVCTTSRRYLRNWRAWNLKSSRPSCWGSMIVLPLNHHTLLVGKRSTFVNDINIYTGLIHRRPTKQSTWCKARRSRTKRTHLWNNILVPGWSVIVMKLKASNIFLEGYEDYFVEQVIGDRYCICSLKLVMPARVISNCQVQWDVKLGLDFHPALTNHLKSTPTWRNKSLPIGSTSSTGISNALCQRSVKTPPWGFALATVKTMEHPSRRDSHLSGLCNNNVAACWSKWSGVFHKKIQFSHIVSPSKL